MKNKNKKGSHKQVEETGKVMPEESKAGLGYTPSENKERNFHPELILTTKQERKKHYSEEQEKYLNQFKKENK